MAIVPYLTDLRGVCGNLFEPVFCFIGFTFLIALGVWRIVAVDSRHRRTEWVSGLMFGVVLVLVAFPGLSISEAWISCSLHSFPSRSAGVAPAPAVLKASLAPRFRRI